MLDNSLILLSTKNAQVNKIVVALLLCTLSLILDITQFYKIKLLNMF